MKMNRDEIARMKEERICRNLTRKIMIYGISAIIGDEMIKEEIEKHNKEVDEQKARYAPEDDVVIRLVD